MTRLVRDQLPVWLTGITFSIALLMITGLLGLILWKGLGVFWPAALEEFQTRDGSHFLGSIHSTEAIPHKTGADGKPLRRTLFRIGNRDLLGNDFIWVEDDTIVSRAHLADVVAVERLEWGPFYGRLAKLITPAGVIEGRQDWVWKALAKELPAARKRFRAIRHMEKDVIGDLSYSMEGHRLAIRRLELHSRTNSAERLQHEHAIAGENARYETLAADLDYLRKEDASFRVVLTAIDGTTKELPVSSVVRIYQPNQLSLIGKAGVYLSRLREFIFDQPREANSEGGVAPAIFGTVMMTLLMSLAVVPLGVLAALYLHEYARHGWIVSVVRIAVNNLAGVPSIVFGVFGLGFFCYFLGGTIDQLFFPEKLPAPTFGGGGILWAALTLALLTVPVVIVATEEALAAVPNGLRAASLACGATQFQTIWRVVLPAASPGILTGTILAMARGAGEVAPLMITGVVKLAPDLPVDHLAPFFHLERKFMHLGFHIYDVGFQSPNVEAAKAMVYMTTILLLGVVICLNLTAMQVRGRLRDQLRGAEV